MARLSITKGDARGRTFELGADQIMGRLPRNPIPLDDEGASRRHARIVVRDGRAFLEDLQSSNGTLVNGHAVQRVELQDGDVITIGLTEMTVSGLAAPRAADVAPDHERPRPSTQRGRADSGVTFRAGTKDRILTTRETSARRGSASLAWLRGDLWQTSALFRLAVAVVAIIVFVTLAWLAYTLTAG